MCYALHQQRCNYLLNRQRRTPMPESNRPDRFCRAAPEPLGQWVGIILQTYDNFCPRRRIPTPNADFVDRSDMQFHQSR